MLSLMLSDELYQWYALGWADMLVRESKGGWKKVRLGQHIRVDSDGSGGTTWMIVTNIVRADTIPELISKYNYMSIYPRSTSVQNTCTFTERVIHGRFSSLQNAKDGYVLVSLKIASILDPSESELDQTSGSTKDDFPNHKYPM